MTDERAKLRVLADLARFAMLEDGNERAVVLGRQALVLAEKLHHEEMRAHLLNTIGVARAALGDSAGLADLEASREISRGVGGPEYLRACGNLASVLTVQGQLQPAAELHREALEIAQELGFEEPTRWLATEIAFDHVLAGEWGAARPIVDELIAGYAESPFWIQPQTRICRARMLLAEGALDDAVLDSDRAVELVRGSPVFQSLCGPFAFRARLHEELGEHEDAAALVEELLKTWVEARAGFIEQWVLDAWFAVRSGRQEAALQGAIEEFAFANPWLEVTKMLIQRDFGPAIEQLERMGALSAAAEARMCGAEWLAQQGRQAEANLQLEPALAFWRSVGARRYLEQGETMLPAAS
jgi:tetratricopeptide (TPR) repeat protein